VRDWLAALTMLGGLALALGSLFTLMGRYDPTPVLLVAHLTAYALILSGFHRLARTQHG
jgi:hypothetical protein